MNENAEKSAQSLAMQAVASKYASGDPAVYASLAGPERFADDVRLVKEKILELLAAHLNGPDASPEKMVSTIRAKNRAKNTASSTSTASITPEAVTHVLADGQKWSLQDLAVRLGATEGKVTRALKALGSSVKSERGINPPGKRGKAPTVYFQA